MLRGQTISEQDVKALKRAGEGGQGDVYFLDGLLVIKLYETKEARAHKNADGQTIS